MHVGIDVSARTLAIAIHETQESWTVPNTAQGIARLRQRLAQKAPGAAVVLEATGHWDLEVASRTTAAPGHPVRRLNPKQARDIARAWGYRTKTDAVDARVLARMGPQFLTPPPPLPAPRHQVLRELRALRDALVAERKAHKQRRHAATQAVVRAHYAAQIAHLAQAIQEVEAQLTAHFGAVPALAEDVALLQTICGVGRDSAHALVLGMPDLATSSPKQAASLLGVAPHAQDSGQHRGPRRCAGGRADLRHALWMAALSARYHNPALRTFADRLAAKGKPHKVVVTAVLRKLLGIAHAILRTRQPWEDLTAVA